MHYFVNIVLALPFFVFTFFSVVTCFVFLFTFVGRDDRLRFIAVAMSMSSTSSSTKLGLFLVSLFSVDEFVGTTNLMLWFFACFWSLSSDSVSLSLDFFNEFSISFVFPMLISPHLSNPRMQVSINTSKSGLNWSKSQLNLAYRKVIYTYNIYYFLHYLQMFPYRFWSYHIQSFLNNKLFYFVTSIFSGNWKFGHFIEACNIPYDMGVELSNIKWFII